MISGSYDPGDLHLFRGLGKGQYAASEVIKDKSDRPILKVPDQKEPVESFGSWTTLVDWDDDGDLDILVGTFHGNIFLRRNEGTRAKPAYATANEWLKVGDKFLRVPGGGHANPVMADWDGDGLWDLITGSSDGGIYWYRNAGKRGQPAWEAPITLVAKHEGFGYDEILQPGETPRPGIRSQIAVTDSNQDGKLDLLLGDFCTYLHVKADLTPEQKTQFAELHRRENEATRFLRDALDAVRARYKEDMKGVPLSQWRTPENSAKWQAAYQSMNDSPAYKQRSDEYDQMQKQMQPFIDTKAAGKHLGGDPAASHGYVWLFLRK